MRVARVDAHARSLASHLCYRRAGAELRLARLGNAHAGHPPVAGERGGVT